MPTHRPSLLVIALLCAGAGAARAQNPAAPVFVQEAPPAKPADWKVQAKGGLILTSGNSQSTTSVLSLSGSRASLENKVSLDGQLAYGRSALLVPTLNAGGDIVGYSRQSETNTNNWQTRARYDRFLTANNALYGLGQVGADKIAGKSFYGGGQAGYSRQLLKNAQHTLVAEIGYDFSDERYVQSPGKTINPVAIHSARLFVGELFALTKATGINASAEALFNLNTENALDASDPTGATTQVKAFKDTRLIGKLGLTTTLYKSLSFGFGFTAKYDQNPAPLPIPASAGALKYAAGFQPFADKVDTLTEGTLIVSFL
jgi:hypothetical protein